MKMDSMKKLYITELRDLYSAEKQIVEAIPKLIKGAAAPELKEAFTSHLEETKEQVKRLENIFSELGEKPTGKMCHGMEGVISEGAELLKEAGDADVLDAGLIAAAQHVEHYEMAGYGSALAHAELLGYTEAAKQLAMTLEEEKAADEKLTKIAMTTINLEAATVTLK